MSLEDAIKEHAAALREIAAAIHELGHGKHLASNIEARAAGYDAIATVSAGESEAKDAIAAMREDQRVGMKDEVKLDAPETAKEFIARGSEEAVKPDAELNAAVDKVEQDAKPLDYKKDVESVLLKVSAKDKTVLRGLLTKYEAKTGPSLKAEHYAAIVADANAYLAG